MVSMCVLKQGQNDPVFLLFFFLWGGGGGGEEVGKESCYWTPLVMV